MRFLSPCRVTPSRSAARVMLPSHAASAASSSSRSVGGDALGDTDVQLYVPTTGVTTTIAGGPGQQRFADVDDDWIAVTDFSEDPDGRFDANETDLADVVLDPAVHIAYLCLLYTSPSPRDGLLSRMPSSA